MTDRYPKTALVTGAATRIGRVIALDMADKGWTVAVHYRNSEKEALAVVDEIRSAGNVGYGNVIWALINTKEFLFIQ